jgi:hypothetical protein
LDALYYLKMNNFDYCKKVSGAQFFRVQYEKSTSYLFFSEFHENVVYAISALNSSQYLRTFEETLR